jgi:hypothetical protein
VAGRVVTGGMSASKFGNPYCPRTQRLCVNTDVRIFSIAVASVAFAAVLCAAVYDSHSARNKLDIIAAGRAPKGARIVFSPAELNAMVADAATLHAPQGARNTRVVLGAGIATGYADIDFLKLRQAATGAPVGWLLQNLFAGERPVKVTARLQSRDGRARVDVERVEVSGIPLEGRALDLAIDAFVRPSFPYATVSEWFDLQYGVDHFTVGPSGVAVFMRR